MLKAGKQHSGQASAKSPELERSWVFKDDKAGNILGREWATGGTHRTKLKRKQEAHSCLGFNLRVMYIKPMMALKQRRDSV